jgi:hypothetical protein
MEESDRPTNANPYPVNGLMRGRLGDRSNVTETLQDGCGKTHFFSLTGRSYLSYFFIHEFNVSNKGFQINHMNKIYFLVYYW